MRIKKYLLVFLLLSACATEPQIDHQFTIAVIPDTQNMVDFTHQRAEGFAIDSADLFIEHMEYLTANTVANGGEIEFITSVGDVWQHLDIQVDPAHYARGMRSIPYSLDMGIEKIMSGRNDFEIPIVRRGYDLLNESGIPFSVAPGNHDYASAWMHNPFPDSPNPREKMEEENIIPNIHVGGYDTFNNIFGENSKYFSGKNWYISSYNGGVNSAQIFEAGGYKFLHFGFEMQAGDDVLNWAQSVIDKNPGLPTMMSTHDYLNPRGERLPSPSYDFEAVDPQGHNSAEEIWHEFIRKNDQIFMILSGHQLGQAFKVSKNDMGNDVYQILADFQGRGQAANPQEGTSPTGIGDGWLRLMEFDTGLDVPMIKVRTYSTYYNSYSADQPDYASWYRDMEQPNMTDEEFLKADQFEIILGDFVKRFGKPQ